MFKVTGTQHLDSHSSGPLTQAPDLFIKPTTAGSEVIRVCVSELPAVRPWISEHGLDWQG